METVFPKVELGMCSLKIGSGATPRGGAKVYISHGVALIRSQNVYNNIFSEDGLAYIGDEHARQLSNVVVAPEDILLNITGDSVARVCQVPQFVLPARVNQHVSIVRPDPTILDVRFLRYCLVSPYMQAHMLSLAGSGATRNALTKGMIEKFDVPCPPFAEQKAIAHILGTLDDKIELNRQMNRTLEDMARAIFKSWFVDFDPVHAKARGAPPAGMDAATAALFPSEFEDSALGPIPKGWQVGQIRDVAHIVRQSVNPSRYPDEFFDHYSIPAYPHGKPIVSQGETIKSNKNLVTPNCVLISKLNPRIPRVWLPFIGETHRPICSTEFFVVEPETNATREHLYSLFSSNEFLGSFTAMVTGTSSSHQRVNRDAFLGMDIVLPSEHIIQCYSELASPLYKMVSANLDESDTLSELRDTLLPKLMSGELRVPEAAEVVEHLT